MIISSVAFEPFISDLTANFYVIVEVALLVISIMLAWTWIKVLIKKSL